MAPPPRSRLATPQATSLPAPPTQLHHPTRQRRPDQPAGILNNEEMARNSDIKSASTSGTDDDNDGPETGLFAFFIIIYCFHFFSLIGITKATNEGDDKDDHDGTSTSGTDDDDDGPETGLYSFFIIFIVFIFFLLIGIMKATNEGDGKDDHDGTSTSGTDDDDDGPGTGLFSFFIIFYCFHFFSLIGYPKAMNEGDDKDDHDGGRDTGLFLFVLLSFIVFIFFH